MNERHEVNRRHWNESSSRWEKLRDEDGLWRRCPDEPELGFDAGALGLIRKTSGNLHGKDVCVVGSGDNYAAFALSGLGGNVTSIDISEEQLQVASRRADQLGLPITFIRSDASDLSAIENACFDLVCSTNGFFVWISDLQGVFSEVHRILRPGGFYIFYDIHPFMRPWKEQIRPLEMEKSYWETGPFEDPESRTYEFNWTLADLLNPMAQAGFILRKILETPPKNARFWEDHSYESGRDESLLDWRTNPRAGLPTWFTVALQKPN